MGEGQQEILREGVQHAEGQHLVVVLTMNRVVGHVTKCVVHPAHVPFKVKAEPAEIRGPADLGPGSGLLGNDQHAGTLRMDHGVELPQEVDGLQVLTAAVLVRDPVGARIIQVEHGRHGIHAYAVYVIFLEPVQDAGEQEVLHLVAAVVEDEGGPVQMLAAPGIGVLVERCAVETGQSVSIFGKVGRHPVQQHADVVLMQVLDEIAEVVWLAETAGRRVIVGRLIAP